MYYKNKEYEKAVSEFNKLTTNEGYLFAGKSFYALGKYEEAQANLNNIPSDAPPQIYQEALYTSALINFQQKVFGEALLKLHEVSATSVNGDLRFNAKRVYQQILNYLTADQRQHVMEEISAGEVKFDLLESALGKIEFQEAKGLYQAFQSNAGDEWIEKARQFEEFLRDTSAYRNKYGEASQELQPPEGTIYNIGLALPRYTPEEREFEIAKALYFGALLAAEEFNESSQVAKVIIRYAETGSSGDGIRPMLEQFTGQYYGDIIIGPLFSEQAKQMVPLVTDIKMPTIAPLANSEIHVQNSYLYQANPTFSIHGKEMARYAVNNLGMKNFAVLVDRNSNGSISAEAFREEAEKLGANIIHYNSEDLQANEFEISRHTRQYGSKEPIDAVYAPFTGQGALQLIDLLMGDLRAMNTPITVLGSQEWQNLDFRSSKYRNPDLKIYFSAATYLNDQSTRLSQFKNKYRQEFNTTGNQYSMIAYDICRYVLDTLKKVGNPALLPSAIANQPVYNGLVTNIHFNGGNINEALQILEVSSTGDLILQR